VLAFVERDDDALLDYASAFEVPQQLGARAELFHAAIQVGIAGGALADARWFVTEKARPFFEAARGGWGETAAEDPQTIQRFGRLATRVRAAETLPADAAGEKHDLSRHWRNARTHSSHDPVDWKYHHAGNWLLGGVLPPNHAQL
jgi:alkylation response protein AidB-like acyl-CoA dehydrogenase